MNFSEKLNEYIDLLDCTAKELSELSGLSPSKMSRLRSGERIPDKNDFQRIIDGIIAVSKRKRLDNITAEALYDDFSKCSDLLLFDIDVFRTNFSHLLSVLSISIADLSKALNYDSSYISRIRSGQRSPADPQKLSMDISNFVARRFDSESEKTVVAQMIGCEKDALIDETEYGIALLNWLMGGVVYESGENSVSAFLKSLDDFDLNEYIRAIHFDELKVPTMPFSLPKSKYYHGIEEMKKGEIDFLKATVLSKSKESVLFYSDMPMDDLAADVDFSKKYMFGLAMLLKKGLHLNIIHDLNRPFNELMLGLESHIPLYMTGQISPYYLKGVQNEVFCHFLKVSGAAALSGESISGQHDHGMYYMTKNRDSIEYYRNRAKDLLSKARPLMEIYREDSQNPLNSFLLSDSTTDGKRRNILSTLPIYTASEEFLNKLFQTNSIPTKEGQSIIAFAEAQRDLTKTILKENTIEDEVPYLTKEEYEKHPMSLSVSGMFIERDIVHSYDEYIEHLNLTKEFEKRYANYKLKLSTLRAFSNINISIHEGEWAMVSKNKTPVIHFVIRHPKLRSAVENMILPVVE